MSCLLPCEQGPSWQYQIFERELGNPYQNPLEQAQFPPNTESDDKKQTVNERDRKSLLNLRQESYEPLHMRSEYSYVDKVI